MAEIDIYILDLFVSYVLPILIGYLFIFHLCWGIWKQLFGFVKVKVLTYTLRSYWKKVYTCNDKELKQTFAPLNKLKRFGDDERLRVLEIGIGEGSNFAYYPPNCDVLGVDPEGAVEPILKENISKFKGLELELFKAAGAEDMSYVENGSVDAVVCTLVLCSVKDPQKVLGEIKRILRKDGLFLFWEHVYAAGKFPLCTFQWIITKCFWFVPCSCNLCLETWKLIEEAKFSKHEYVKRRIAVMPLDGVFIFWEHVYASNNERLARKQCLLANIWYFLFGGCHLTRKSWEFIKDAQFSTHEFSTITLPVISLVSSTMFGSATK